MMKRFQRKNRFLRKRLTKTKERIVETIFLFSAATLQQMNEKEKKEKKKNTINADEKSAKMNMKELMKKKFEKKKENFRYVMFEDLVVKNSNMRTSAKYYINDTTSFSNIIENFLCEFENVLKKKRCVSEINE